MTALALVERLRPYDTEGEIQALNAFVRDRIRYTRDVLGVETVQTPQATLMIGQGDCDDKATLLASLLMSIGIPAKFGMIRRGNTYLHVFTIASCRGKPIDCETTLPVPCGTLPALGKGDTVETYGIRPYGL